MDSSYCQVPLVNSMPPPRNTDDPENWRQRAARMRALALTMKDPETVILMNDLAADYDKQADRVALKAKRKGPLNSKLG
jgi:hypothetical protein